MVIPSNSKASSYVTTRKCGANFQQQAHQHVSQYLMFVRLGVCVLECEIVVSENILVWIGNLFFKELVY